MVDQCRFGLGTFAGADRAPFPGLVVDGGVIDLRGHLGVTDTLALLDDWGRSRPMLHRLAVTLEPPAIRLTDVHVLPPVRSRQLLCAGANYYKHVREIMYSMHKNAGDPRSDEELRRAAAELSRRRRAEQEPFVFAGLTSALSGAHDDVVLWGPGQQHDWELELAVVIGRSGRDIPAGQALGHVAGYTISNDISARYVMFRPNFRMTDFLASKCRPTFFPTGPYMVPVEFVPTPQDLRVRLSVNGETMQDERLSDMIYGIEELVSYASRVVDLLPGDTLLTGSPAGNAGHHNNRWLRPGDILEGEITGLGSQRNRCVAPPPARAAAMPSAPDDTQDLRKTASR